MKGQFPETALDKGSFKNLILALSLFLLGFSLALFHSRFGFHPMDHSSIFDGGWRILSGQIPYQDFYTPNGMIPSAIQALFFKLFGVSWFSYCLHSSFINGLFTAVVFLFLRSHGAPRFVATVYATMSSLFLYPTIGVPSSNHHSFFFSLVFLWLMQEGLRVSPQAQKKASWLAWFFIPAILSAGYLSSQIPILFTLAAAIPLLLFRTQRLTFKKTAVPLLSGTLLVALTASGYIFLSGTDIHKFYLYSFTIPLSHSKGQYGDLFNLAQWMSCLRWDIPVELRRVIDIIRKYCIFSVPLAALLFFFGRKKKTVGRLLKILEKSLAAYLLTLVMTGFALLTKKDPNFYLAFLPASLGLVHLSISETMKILARITNRDFLYRSARLAILTGIVGIGAYKTHEFNRLILLPKARFERTYTFTETEKTPVCEGMSFLIWGLPKDLYSKDDFCNTRDFLERSEGNFMILGDTTVLYGLTKKPSTMPLLWLQSGLTYPDTKSSAFSELQNRMTKNLDRYNVRYIVFDAPPTWKRNRISDFPAFNTMIAKHKVGEIKFGNFLIYKLADLPDNL